jgi:phage terminase small subunit
VGEIELTDRQKLFCKEYIVDLNATQAAIRAGYSVKTATEMGYENLSKPHIHDYVMSQVRERMEKVDITAEKVLYEIAKLAFSNIDDYMTVDEEGLAYVDLSKMTRDQAAAVTEITVDSYFDTELASGDDKGKRVKKTKLKLADKKASLELLGKYLKLFSDINVNVDNSQHTYYTKIDDKSLIEQARAEDIDLPAAIEERIKQSSAK